MSTDVTENQRLFREKAADLRELQSWLAGLLGAHGKVRCYKTEGDDPRKQMKNKLSQAVDARDGLLVLVLADEPAFQVAHEALVHKWMSNPEWPKPVACVALSFPPAAPEVRAIVVRKESPWKDAIKTLIFPNAQVAEVQRPAPGLFPASECASCQEELPKAANYCPNCGTRVKPVP